MRRVHLAEDTKPLSEFQANATALVDKVRETKRPLVLTQEGHGAAVVVDVTKYERLLEEVEILRDVKIAERQLAEGQGIPHEEAKSRLLSWFTT